MLPHLSSEAKFSVSAPTSPSKVPDLNGLEMGDTSRRGHTASSLDPSIQKPSYPPSSPLSSATRTVFPTCS